MMLVLCLPANAQNRFACTVKDAVSKDNMPGVTASLFGAKRTVVADSNGKVVFTNLPIGDIEITFSFVGYENREQEFHIPQSDAETVVYMHKAEAQMNEVIVSSSRTNSRIEDLPTRVEVIGSEEIDEEASTIPGNVTALLGDVAGIQNKRASATTGNIDIHVQGLSGKYTQILRDGMPLFGGYSGGFGILQIPPLDLKQVEIIKGSSSTLYGGGAIAGMINLISKSPQLNAPQHSILLNHSTLNETNINSYFSNRSAKAGYTVFAGTTLQRATDVNKDGFSDVPDLQAFFLHPKLFLYPDKKNQLSFGYNGTYEDRKGGDMQVLHATKDSQHQFFVQNKSFRNTLEAAWENKPDDKSRLDLKGITSFYNRDITTNIFGMKAFQLSYFSELSYYRKFKRHALVIGLNISGDNFTKKTPDSSSISNYAENTIGVFVQDDWTLSKKLIVQSGLRLDKNSSYSPVLLPRLSILYRASPAITTRLGGGLGYKSPTVFSSELDERDLQHIALSSNVQPERSLGANWDINYKKRFSDILLIVNQSFFFTQVNHPLIIDSSGVVNYYVNAGRPVNTCGFETYVQLKKGEMDAYLGYTYTYAKQLYNAAQPELPLNARSKFATLISGEITDHFKAGFELSYISRQWLDDGSTVPGYFISAALLRYDLPHIAIVLNCEDLFDYRQTKKENIVLPPYSNPVFRQVWAPLEGRVLNLSVNVHW